MDWFESHLLRRPEASLVFNKFLAQVRHPSPDWNVIRSSELGIHPNLILATGTDSVICSTADRPLKEVIKIYNRYGFKVPVEQLRFYQELLQQSGAVLHDSGLNPELSTNPIIGLVYWPEQNCWVSVGKFVPGFNLKEVFGIEGSGNPDLQIIREEIGKIGLDKTGTEALLTEASNLIGNRLAVTGISIIPLNVKAILGKGVSSSDLKFIVTDLSGSISKIKKTQG